MSDSGHDWIKAWEKNDIGFHQQNVNQGLLSHADQMIKVRKNIKIFLPLCGKTVDMKWLWDKGHSVVGVDLARKAFEDFFKEQTISYSVRPLPNGEGEIFTSDDNKIKLYCCDLFKFNSSFDGQYEAIWDRGSLVAIDKSDRHRYAELMKSLMTNDCRYLLETLDYDEAKFEGPPYFVSEQKIRELFGSTLQMCFLEKKEIFSEEFRNWGIDSLFINMYLLSSKK